MGILWVDKDRSREDLGWDWSRKTGSLHIRVLLEESEQNAVCLHSCRPVWGAGETWMKLGKRERC